jgi:menaquinone-dependent protoporphyrinogen oxidase
MSQRILVAHASRAGSTAEVAETIGEVLRESGSDVDVRSVKDLHSVAGYDALVLGTAIWAGKPLPEMLKFAAAQQDAFAQKPVAYFILCDTLKEDTPGNREIARRYLEPLLKVRQSVSLGLFAGARDFSKLHPLLRWFFTRVIRLPEGDWRDWEQIRSWATELAPRLAAVQPALAAIG